MNKLDDVTKDLLKKDIPDFAPGDTISMDIRVVEGEKERVQRYQGVVIARKHGGIEETITVRKISNGIGVERIFPIHSPMIASIKVISTFGETDLNEGSIAEVTDGNLTGLDLKTLFVREK